MTAPSDREQIIAKVAEAMYRSDAMCAYLETVEPDELDTDVRIDGTINFTALATAAFGALTEAWSPPF